MLTDTHCHLYFDSFDDDRDQVVSRARDAGVGRIIVPAIDLQSAKSALQLSERYPEVFVAVGFHPNDLSEWRDSAIEALENLAQHPRVVAIGEIGLDYYRDRTPREQQRRAFEEQLALAARVMKPVIIHTRESAADALAILEAWRTTLKESQPSLAQRPGVLHSFSGEAISAEKAISIGFYIGITGPVTFTNARNLQTLVKSLPLDRLLIETDAPFLTPHPHRGKRNEPAYVAWVAAKIAELHGLSTETVGTITSHNAANLFGWKE